MTMSRIRRGVHGRNRVPSRGERGPIDRDSPIPIEAVDSEVSPTRPALGFSERHLPDLSRDAIGMGSVEMGNPGSKGFDS